jgi:predicted TIM-barrel fold metal-dependent hydrolase
MLDGHLLVDAHLHPVRLPTLKPAWRQWAREFGDQAAIESVYDADGTVVPERFDAYLAAEGVDVALVLAEYSPKVTGIQPIEDLLPLAAFNRDRIRIIANVNPHLHYPVDEEAARQLGLGAVALKIHPVHAGVAANDRSLYPAYEVCQAAGVPLVVHCGTSTFPGSSNGFADPVLLDDVLRDFRRLDVVLAHGGRGWWYDAAAFMALSSQRVWIELSGLPPSRLREYYARHSWARLTRRMIFGTDWPGVPGIASNARAVAALCPDEATAALVLGGNACRVYNLKADLPDGTALDQGRRAAVGRGQAAAVRAGGTGRHRLPGAGARCRPGGRMVAGQ